ncbi:MULTISPECIES: hypothetical protein [Streptomyces]|uniref:hypothetical protein n=1 Tax=Streptomyces TaxID=1883 RepID=UPI00025CE0FC|nr:MULTISPECIES: hypothetical protein [Streptomyces]AZK98802.1 hypothetical protein B7R87_33105 [Streptomyces tsukubensis]EIF87885.1 hypothetical protein [Streptomyces tsukubensis NRRL18488]
MKQGESGGGHLVVVGVGAERLGEAGPGVEQRAEAVADAVCELVDVVAPGSWSAGAVEDAADAIDLLAEALAAIDPEAARALAAVPAATAALRRRLVPGAVEEAPEVPAPRSERPPRRGLGPGWKGVRTTG